MLAALTRFCIERSRLTVFFIVAIIVAGFTSFLSQPSQEDPEITIRFGQITASYPGLAAEKVEQLIIRPIEENLKQIPEIKFIKSQATTGQALVTVRIYPSYFDLDPIWSDIRNKMDDLKPNLPEGTQGPFVNDDYGRVSVATLALYGDEYDYKDLRSVARNLRDRIGALELVSRVDLYGIQEERVWLEMNQDKLAQIDLSANQVVNTLKDQNIILPGGNLIADGLSIGIDPTGNFDSVKEIENVAIQTGEDTGVVYLKDLLTVRRGYVDPPERPALYNGRPAVILGISMVPNIAIKEFAAQLEAEIAILTAELPLGLNLDYATYQPPIVDASIKDATSNLMQTLATVLVVVMLFLGLRTGTIVGSVVPITILAAIIAMRLFEIPLHRISIAAIIISLGLLVDNGIVIAEDIKTRLSQGMERLNACIEAARSLGLPLLTSSLTTILAFMPLMLADDETGEFMSALSQVVTATLLASWGLAITVTPALCYWFLGDRKKSKTKKNETEVKDLYGGTYYNLFRKFLNFMLRVRIPFLVVMFALLILSVKGLEDVPKRLLPPSDRAQFVLPIRLQAGVDVRETQAVVKRFSDWVNNKSLNPEITSSTIFIANGGPRFFLALSPPDPAPNTAFAIINVANPEDRDPTMAKVDRFIIENMPEAEGFTEKLFLGSTKPGTVELRILGPDIPTLMDKANEVMAGFRTIPGTQDIRSDWENPVIRIKVAIDQERARRAGTDSRSIAQALSTNFDGETVTSYREGDKVIPVILRSEEDKRSTLDDLRSVTVPSSNGNVVPLIQIADIDGDVVPSQIRRYNQERAITISAINPNMEAAGLYAAMQPTLEKLDLPYNYKIEVDGELKGSEEANAALFKYMPHCMGLMLLLLIWQFNSFRKPFIIAFTIPLLIIGASLGLNLTGAYLDFNAMLGLISLAGIIINNGIVLIDKIDLERANGTDLKQAIIESAVSRLRPIVMTTLTTILGLVPLMIFGGELWFAMTVVIMFGLTIGTILTLGVVPVLYSLLFGAIPNLFAKITKKPLADSKA
ncbi:efflux RND transporter permease subunit [Curvivirga sp.]|uniref:efflux RND transporter permease subunit n=1 Tax=Curvivirga sp. TaxID=2856848 RepID=UPI003B5BC309